MMKRWNLLVLIALLSGACTLRIGWPSELTNRPAPTSAPLAETAAPGGAPNPPDHPVRLPPGFAISVYAAGLDQPRMLAVSPAGELYAAERGAGRVVRLPDQDGDGLADAVEPAAGELEEPTSLAFARDGALYVAESARVLAFRNPDEQGLFREREVVIDGLPAGHHRTRTILFSPDFTALFVSIGSTCNVCIEEDERRATIMRFDPDGSGGEVYAGGLRNAVGIAFRPGTEELWATNNGVDFMGDELPPETIYHIQAGADYGWPRCHAGRIVDPKFGEGAGCQDVPAPAVEITAHSAPLGLEFYSGEMFPAEYRGDLFVALHGSWNRTNPTGYKLVRIPMDGGRPGAVQDFAVGWLPESGEYWGRPVDVVTGADGSLFVSDDSSGRIYRIFYMGE
jgi:glucose/arabinose dehydrogenase